MSKEKNEKKKFLLLLYLELSIEGLIDENVSAPPAPTEERGPTITIFACFSFYGTIWGYFCWEAKLKLWFCLATPENIFD